LREPLKGVEMNKTFPWVDQFLDRVIFPFQKEIADRLREKDRLDEMKTVYDEIEPQMRPLPNIDRLHSADEILSAIIDGAACYSGKNDEGVVKAKAERQRMKDIEGLHAEIIEKTRKLIRSLESFNEMQVEGYSLSGAYIDVFHLVKKAGRGDSVFDEKIKPLLDAAAYQGFGHNPSFRDILESLICEIQDAEVYPITDEDAAALYSQKTELSFVRYFIMRLHKARGITIPENLSLTNKSIVAITRCALNLPDDALSESEISQAKSKIKIFLD
jgi:hypothetical protein